MRYLLRKVSYMLLTLYGVVTVVFILFNVLPGDPARMMLGQNESDGQLQIIKEKYGFNQPLTTQYIYFLNDLSPLSLHLNETNHYTNLSSNKYNHKNLFSANRYSIVLKYPYLRTSFAKSGKRVTEIIYETLPNTIVLATTAILIAIFFGLIFGVISALFKDQFIDKFIQIISTLGMSVPSFFSAVIVAWIFGFVLHNYTGLEMSGSLYVLDDFGESYNLELKNLLLPSFVLGIRPLAVISQLMRNSLLEVLAKEYIRTARAKGLSELEILKNHALKNALNPVVTAISGWFASLLAGAVFVEYIFGWNGIGKEIVSALNSLDLPVIMGAVLTIALIFSLINITVDIIYRYLDPKIKSD